MAYTRTESVKGVEYVKTLLLLQPEQRMDYDLVLADTGFEEIIPIESDREHLLAIRMNKSFKMSGEDLLVNGMSTAFAGSRYGDQPQPICTTSIGQPDGMSFLMNGYWYEPCTMFKG